MTKPKKFDNVIILHGCPPDEQHVTPTKDRWMNWLEGELKKEGLDAVAPEMPNPWNPQYPEWKKVFEKYSVTEDTLLVGHSCGAAFLVRWLLENGNKVKKLILVAPAKVPEGNSDPRKELYNFKLPTDASHIADEIVIFTSNDYPHHLQSLKLYKSSLRPRVVQLENRFHFVFFQMKTNEFPELFNEVMK